MPLEIRQTFEKQIGYFFISLYPSLFMASEFLIPLSAVYLFFIIQSMGNSVLSLLNFKSASRFRKEKEFIMVDSKLDEFEKYIGKTGEDIIYSTITFGLIMFFEYTHFNGFYLPKIGRILFTVTLLVGWVLIITHQIFLKKAIDKILAQRGKSAKADTG